MNMYFDLEKITDQCNGVLAIGSTFCHEDDFHQATETVPKC